MRADTPDKIHALADLIASGTGADVQPGQIVVSSARAPGKEPLTRAIAEAAYKAGAKFVDLSVFDIFSSAPERVYAAPDTARVRTALVWRAHARDRRRARSEYRAHRSGRAPCDGRGRPALLGQDLLPALREAVEVVNQRTTNWTAAPCPTAAWAELVRPELPPDEALERLWQDVIHVCRVDEDDPVAAWEERMDRLTAVAQRLDGLALEAVRFEGREPI